MKLGIYAVGHKMPEWLTAGFAEYSKRMPRETRIELNEIKPEKRVSGKSTEQLLEAERGRILADLPQQCIKIVLDERGEMLTTLQLAERLKQWMQMGQDAAFVIGGADGLHEDIKRDTSLLWSLSRLTLPHALVRVLLAEQLYRAVTVIQGHPYHRE